MQTIEPTYIQEDFNRLTKKINPIFEGLVSRIRNFYKRISAKVHYDLYEEIATHEFKKSKLKPHIAARKWFRKYAHDKNNHFKGFPLVQGQLYTYRYKYPKWRDTLDFWDTEPLMLCIGHFKTKNNEIREIGINLHMLPYRVRVLVLYEITNRLYKAQYKNRLYKENQNRINVNWKDIKKPLERFGVDFAVRVYIPQLRQETIRFKVEDYSSAIYLTSRQYQKVTPVELEQLWREHTKKNKLKDVVNESFM